MELEAVGAVEGSKHEPLLRDLAVTHAAGMFNIFINYLFLRVLAGGRGGRGPGVRLGDWEVR